MTQLLRLYGFGSFFLHGSSPNDIDLLIIHNDISPESIGIAIKSKLLIKAIIPNAHIVMLSMQEERYLGFIDRSKSVLLEVISDVNMPDQLRQLARRILI